MSKKSSTFALPNHPMLLSHLPYYQDRRSTADLCYDYPADEALIDGLHGMQCYLWNNGQNIDIPVLRVMNTAHYMASYMFHTECSGDQAEYDVMAYMSMGHDRTLTAITLITLAAMLERTEGLRARHCRSILLEDRSEDFYEGVSLYQRFLHSADRRFEEQDFMTDVMAELTDLKNLAQQLTNDKLQLQKQIKTMENQQQRNAPIINVAGDYIDIHDNHHCNIYATEPQHPTTLPEIVEDDEPQMGNYSFFGTDKFAADICEKNLREAITNARSKAEACRNIMTLDTCGYLHIRHLTDAQKAELINPFAAPRYVFTEDDFKKARNRPNKK